MPNKPDAPDDEVPKWALERMAKKRRRWEQRRAAFMAKLPEGYPGPRAELEWQAHNRLSQWWSPPQIRKFIKACGTDHMIYPGTLDTPGRPSLTEFRHDVGLIAEGEYARTLPEDAMLLLLAGDDAARGLKFPPGSRHGRRDALGKLIVRALKEFPERLTWRQIIQHLKEGDPDGNVIQEINCKYELIFWIDDKNKEKTTTFAQLRKRISNYRKLI